MEKLLKIFAGKTFLLVICACLTCCTTSSQSLQMHYDFRHTVDPKRNAKNYPTLYFEYFKTLDSGKSFIKPGSFLLKLQADFTGDQTNLGKYYMQVSQEFRCWTPKIYLDLQYSGGLGITDPRQYSYYILNTYSAGLSYPFHGGKGYFSTVLFYKYVPYSKPSNDFLYTFYFYRGIAHYKLAFLGDFSVWTENKNHGDDLTKAERGKRFFFFAEPQLWWNIKKGLAAGTKIDMNFHVLTTDNLLQVYPTMAVRYKF